MKRMKKMKKILIIFTMLLLFGCEETNEIENIKQEQEEVYMKENIKLIIDNQEVEVEWLDNESTKAIKELLLNETIEINMSIYGGFEQVGSIGHKLPTNDVQLKTKAGDIVLYNGNQLVIFFGSNSWSYTKLGELKISDNEIKDLLNKESINVTLELD